MNDSDCKTKIPLKTETSKARKSATGTCKCLKVQTKAWWCKKCRTTRRKSAGSSTALSSAKPRKATIQGSNSSSNKPLRIREGISNLQRRLLLYRGILSLTLLRCWEGRCNRDKRSGVSMYWVSRGRFWWHSHEVSRLLKCWIQGLEILIKD